MNICMNVCMYVCVCMIVCMYVCVYVCKKKEEKKGGKVVWFLNLKRSSRKGGSAPKINCTNM